MEIKKNHFWDTSVCAPILLKQFQNSPEFNTEPENKCPFPSHIGSFIPTFRDMYYILIVRRKIYQIIAVKLDGNALAKKSHFFQLETFVVKTAFDFHSFNKCNDFVAINLSILSKLLVLTK